MSENELRLIPVSRLTAGGRWRAEAMRSYSVDQLLWFTRGQGRLTVGGVTRGFGAHNAVFIPAGTMHAFHFGTQVFGTAVFFARDHGLPLPGQPLHLRIREASDQIELTSLLDNLQREAEGDRPARIRAMGYLAGAVSVWLERQLLDHEDALAASDAARRLSRRYSDMVERNFASDMTVSDYAARLGVTSTHLTRVCKAICGTTASDLLSQRKFSEARRLLVDTDIPIKDIAQGLGFHSPAYFTRAFGQRMGASPGSIRRDG